MVPNFLNSTTNKTKTNPTTRTNSTSKSHTTSTNESHTLSTNDSKTATITMGVAYDELNKSAEYCEKLVEKYVERFQKGLNHGMWNTSLYIQSDDKSTLAQVEHVLKSVYSGDDSYYEPIRFSDVFLSKKCDVKNLPMLYAKEYENPIHTSFSGFSTALNTEELSLLAALPHRDIQGVQVSQHTSFGLTQNNSDKATSDNIEIGYILHRGEKTKQRFKISFDTLNHHLFVSGITGSGKSNSIKGILTRLQKQVPFLVIEPAKSEYKNLKLKIDDLQIFSPGDSDDILRLNPFVFEKQNELTRHIDTLKATFIAAFPMEGPMPYVLESALHKVYMDKGWDFKNERHPLFVESEFADYNQQSLLFPTIEDLYNVIDSVVETSRYHTELDSNLKAALKTRIKNLTLGAKGKIYNTRHCFSNKILFEKPTIIELSHIADDCEKSFLMGILLNKLYQYRQQQGDSNGELKHICVIEEAHRLLPNISLEIKSDEQNARGAAVQVFINMLAEIRSYGEGLVIADQIASKLHRDVIKNTGTKIIHRTMDKEDRDIIGHSINLSEDQILDIATLKAGEAIVHNAQVHEAFMVGMDNVTCDIAQKDEIKRFYKEFLESHKIYAYEYLFENRYALPISKKILIFIKNIPLIKRKELLLGLFKDILLDRPMQDIKESYNNISAAFESFTYNNAESGAKERLDSKDLGKACCYFFVETFREFDFLSNMTYFNNIGIYSDIIEVFCDFMFAMSCSDEKDIDECNKDIRKYFAYKNFKERFQSMNGYDRNCVDYTLLLEETISVMNFNEACKEILADTTKDVLDRINEILIKLGFIPNRLLQYSLFAIHFKDNKNFLNLVE